MQPTSNDADRARFRLKRVAVYASYASLNHETITVPTELCQARDVEISSQKRDGFCSLRVSRSWAASCKYEICYYQIRSYELCDTVTSSPPWHIHIHRHPNFICTTRTKSFIFVYFQGLRIRVPLSST
jgi:hypothetical protein